MAQARRAAAQPQAGQQQNGHRQQLQQHRGPAEQGEPGKELENEAAHGLRSSFSSASAP
jgi:hypothetical protein